MQNNNSISLEEYNELIEIKNKYSMIIKALFKKAELSYIEDGLNFDCGDICTLIEYLEPEKYEDTVKKLKEIRESKRKENNG